MSTLMKYPELEAFTAQKKAGSTSAYFELLATFLDILPDLTENLRAPAEDDDYWEFYIFTKKVEEIQKQLIGIGAPALLWEAEKLAELAEAKDVRTCAEATESFILQLKTLSVKIDLAKVTPSISKVFAKTASTPPLPDAPYTTRRPWDGKERPKTQLKFATVEKLGLLIENFEMDEALEMLNKLMEYSYDSSIDSAFNTIYYHLTHFNYDHADSELANLSELTQALDSLKESKTMQVKSDKKKILAVDDVPDVLNTVKSVLKEKYAVYGVTNHLDALRFLTNNHADLILLDIEMPDMNGFALLNLIRKIDAYSTTPVLFITSNVTPENLKKVRRDNASSFLRKPINRQLLLEKTEKYLEVKPNP